MLPHRSNRLVSLLPLLLTVSLTAQRVVVVDQANGPGTNWTTLTAAFADLHNDDYIIVRAGVYGGVAVTTGYDFVMVGEGNPIVNPTGTNTAMRITMNGSSYQRIAIRGLEFQSLVTGQPALRLDTNYAWWPSPSAELENVTAISLSPQADKLGLRTVAIGLTATNCHFAASSISDCLASFVGCQIIGDNASYYLSSAQRAMGGLSLNRSEVWLVDTIVDAGESMQLNNPPAAAIGFTESSYTTTSKVHVSGSSILSADQSPSPVWAVPAVLQNYQTWWVLPSNVDYEPTVGLVTAPGGTIANANIVTTVHTVPTLQASDAPLGGAWTCTAHGATNDVAILAIGTETHAQTLLGMSFLVDTGLAVVVGFAALGGSGTGSATFAPLAIPNNPTLRGTVLQGTGLFLAPNGALQASNPVTGILH